MSLYLTPQLTLTRTSQFCKANEDCSVEFTLASNGIRVKESLPLWAAWCHEDDEVSVIYSEANIFSVTLSQSNQETGKYDLCLYYRGDIAPVTKIDSLLLIGPLECVFALNDVSYDLLTDLSSPAVIQIANPSQACGISWLSQEVELIVTVPDGQETVTASVSSGTQEGQLTIQRTSNCVGEYKIDVSLSFSDSNLEALFSSYSDSFSIFIDSSLTAACGNLTVAIDLFSPFVLSDFTPCFEESVKVISITPHADSPPIWKIEENTATALLGDTSYLSESLGYVVTVQEIGGYGGKGIIDLFASVSFSPSCTAGKEIPWFFGSSDENVWPIEQTISLESDLGYSDIEYAYFLLDDETYVVEQTDYDQLSVHQLPVSDKSILRLSVVIEDVPGEYSFYCSEVFAVGIPAQKEFVAPENVTLKENTTSLSPENHGGEPDMPTLDPEYQGNFSPLLTYEDICRVRSNMTLLERVWSFTDSYNRVQNSSQFFEWEALPSFSNSSFRSETTASCFVQPSDRIQDMFIPKDMQELLPCASFHLENLTFAESGISEEIWCGNVASIPRTLHISQDSFQDKVLVEHVIKFEHYPQASVAPEPETLISDDLLVQWELPTNAIKTQLKLILSDSNEQIYNLTTETSQKLGFLWAKDEFQISLIFSSTPSNNLPPIVVPPFPVYTGTVSFSPALDNPVVFGSQGVLSWKGLFDPDSQNCVFIVDDAGSIVHRECVSSDVTSLSLPVLPYGSQLNYAVTTEEQGIGVPDQTWTFNVLSRKYPGLHLSSVSRKDQLIQTGDLFSLEYTVCNVGDQSTGPQRWTDEIVLHVFRPAEQQQSIIVGTIKNERALGPSTCYTVDYTDGLELGPLAHSLAGCIANIEVIIDSGRVVPESADVTGLTKEKTIGPFSVLIGDYSFLVADAVEILTSNLMGGDIINFSFDIVNVGSNNSPEIQKAVLRVLVCNELSEICEESSAVSMNNITVDIPYLSPGSRASVNHQTKIPATLSGSFVLAISFSGTVVEDLQGKLEEPENSASPVSLVFEVAAVPQPDLSLTQVSIETVEQASRCSPSSPGSMCVYSGSAIRIKYTIQNDGSYLNSAFDPWKDILLMESVGDYSIIANINRFETMPAQTSVIQTLVLSLYDLEGLYKFSIFPHIGVTYPSASFLISECDVWTNEIEVVLPKAIVSTGGALSASSVGAGDTVSINVSVSADLGISPPFALDANILKRHSLDTKQTFVQTEQIQIDDSEPFDMIIEIPISLFEQGGAWHYQLEYIYDGPYVVEFGETFSSFTIDISGTTAPDLVASDIYLFCDETEISEGNLIPNDCISPILSFKIDNVSPTSTLVGGWFAQWRISFNISTAEWRHEGEVESSLVISGDESTSVEVSIHLPANSGSENLAVTIEGIFSITNEWPFFSEEGVSGVLPQLSFEPKDFLLQPENTYALEVLENSIEASVFNPYFALLSYTYSFSNNIVPPLAASWTDCIYAQTEIGTVLCECIDVLGSDVNSGQCSFTSVSVHTNAALALKSEKLFTIVLNDNEGLKLDPESTTSFSVPQAYVDTSFMVEQITPRLIFDPCTANYFTQASARMIALFCSVQNNGSAVLENPDWTDNFFLCDVDSELSCVDQIKADTGQKSSSALLLGMWKNRSPLAPGESYLTKSEIALTSMVPEGNYILLYTCENTENNFFVSTEVSLYRESEQVSFLALDTVSPPNLSIESLLIDEAVVASGTHIDLSVETDYDFVVNVRNAEGAGFFVGAPKLNILFCINNVSDLTTMPQNCISTSFSVEDGSGINPGAEIVKRVKTRIPRSLSGFFYGYVTINTFADDPSYIEEDDTLGNVFSFSTRVTVSSTVNVSPPVSFELLSSTGKPFQNVSVSFAFHVDDPENALHPIGLQWWLRDSIGNLFEASEATIDVSQFEEETQCVETLEIPPLRAGNYELVLDFDTFLAYKDSNTRIETGETVQISVDSLEFSTPYTFHDATRGLFVFNHTVSEDVDISYISPKGVWADIFVARNSVPTPDVAYLARNQYAYTDNPHVSLLNLVPGIYYVLVTSSSVDNAEIRLELVVPEFSSVQPKTVGRGLVTFGFTGTGFDESVSPSLFHQSVELRPVATALLSDTKFEAQFNLSDVSAGSVVCFNENNLGEGCQYEISVVDGIEDIDVKFLYNKNNPSIRPATAEVVITNLGITDAECQLIRFKNLKNSRDAIKVGSSTYADIVILACRSEGIVGYIPPGSSVTIDLQITNFENRWFQHEKIGYELLSNDFSSIFADTSSHDWLSKAILSPLLGEARGIQAILSHSHNAALAGQNATTANELAMDKVFNAVTNDLILPNPIRDHLLASNDLAKGGVPGRPFLLRAPRPTILNWQKESSLGLLWFTPLDAQLLYANGSYILYAPFVTDIVEPIIEDGMAYIHEDETDLVYIFTLSGNMENDLYGFGLHQTLWVVDSSERAAGRITVSSSDARETFLLSLTNNLVTSISVDGQTFVKYKYSPSHNIITEVSYPFQAISLSIEYEDISVAKPQGSDLLLFVSRDASMVDCVTGFLPGSSIAKLAYKYMPRPWKQTLQTLPSSVFSWAGDQMLAGIGYASGQVRKEFNQHLQSTYDDSNNIVAHGGVATGVKRVEYSKQNEVSILQTIGNTKTTTKRTYDSRGRVSSSTAPGQSYTQYTYVDGSDQIETVQGTGKSWAQTESREGEIITETANGLTMRSYHVAQFHETQIAGFGQFVEFDRVSQHIPTKKVYGSSLTTGSLVSNRLTETSPNGQTTEYVLKSNEPVYGYPAFLSISASAASAYFSYLDAHPLPASISSSVGALSIEQVFRRVGPQLIVRQEEQHAEVFAVFAHSPPGYNVTLPGASFSVYKNAAENLVLMDDEFRVFALSADETTILGLPGGVQHQVDHSVGTCGYEAFNFFGTEYSYEYDDTCRPVTASGVSGIRYNAANQITRFEIGDSVTEISYTSERTRSAVSGHAFTIFEGMAQITNAEGSSFTWGANGNLLKIADSDKQFSAEFSWTSTNALKSLVVTVVDNEYSFGFAYSQAGLGPLAAVSYGNNGTRFDVFWNLIGERLPGTTSLPLITKDGELCSVSFRLSDALLAHFGAGGAMEVALLGSDNSPVATATFSEGNFSSPQIREHALSPFGDTFDPLYMVGSGAVNLVAHILRDELEPSVFESICSRLPVYVGSRFMLPALASYISLPANSFAPLVVYNPYELLLSNPYMFKHDGHGGLRVTEWVARFGDGVPLGSENLVLNANHSLSLHISAPSGASANTLAAAHSSSTGKAVSTWGLQDLQPVAPVTRELLGGARGPGGRGLSLTQFASGISKAKSFYNSDKFSRVRAGASKVKSAIDSDEFGAIMDVAGLFTKFTPWDVYGMVSSVMDCMEVIKENSASLQWVYPVDPNDIIGPEGTGPERAFYVPSDRHATLTYKVRFENSQEAGAIGPVHFMKVAVHVPPELDPGSLFFAEIGIGETVEPVGKHTSMTNDFTVRGYNNETVLIDSSGVYNAQTGDIEIYFVARNPRTRDTLWNAFEGFLSPYDAAQSGGYVKFSLSSARGIQNETTIALSADITFDTEEPISTPVWTNLYIRGDVAASVGSMFHDSDSGISYFSIAATPSTSTVTLFVREGGSTWQSLGSFGYSGSLLAAETGRQGLAARAEGSDAREYMAVACTADGACGSAEQGLSGAVQLGDTSYQDFPFTAPAAICPGATAELMAFPLPAPTLAALTWTPVSGGVSSDPLSGVSAAIQTDANADALVVALEATWTQMGSDAREIVVSFLPVVAPHVRVSSASGTHFEGAAPAEPVNVPADEEVTVLALEDTAVAIGPKGPFESSVRTRAPASVFMRTISPDGCEATTALGISAEPTEPAEPTHVLPWVLMIGGGAVLVTAIVFIILCAKRRLCCCRGRRDVTRTCDVVVTSQTSESNSASTYSSSSSTEYQLRKCSSSYTYSSCGLSDSSDKLRTAFEEE
eukprot:gnl/Chilomastix_cuspidata/2654.p1 GENE.gnl/Chilomastix_cuspidata/2654~~gnl/Chilomastix_cuspidata/2654.p1  ORF type:complete len:4021 (+),score=539.07 gnl/Chilomastix_cuspidata/2654:191-12064(+)